MMYASSFTSFQPRNRFTIGALPMRTRMRLVRPQKIFGCNNAANVGIRQIAGISASRVLWSEIFARYQSRHEPAISTLAKRKIHSSRICDVELMIEFTPYGLIR